MRQRIGGSGASGPHRGHQHRKTKQLSHHHHHHRVETAFNSRVQIAQYSEASGWLELTPSGAEWPVEKLHDQISSWADGIDEFSEHTLEVVFDELGVPEPILFDMANAESSGGPSKVVLVSAHVDQQLDL